MKHTPSGTDEKHGASQKQAANVQSISSQVVAGTLFGLPSVVLLGL